MITGVGRFAARRSMARAFTDPTDICVSSGLVGSLKHEYRLGDVLAARAVSDFSGSHLVYSDPSLLSQAIASGARRVERLISSDRVISTAAEKESLGASADAVDMESLYVLSAAAHCKIPAVAIRAVSDGVEMNLPFDLSRVFNERGAVSLPKVIGQLVARPGRIGGLLRLADQSERAASALAAFLDAYVRETGHDPLEEVAKADAIAI